MTPAPNPLQQLAEQTQASVWRPIARVVMGLLVLLFVWAALAQLDEVAVAEGQVVPEGRVKTIQHLEGGIVREIHVRDGQIVKEGEPLLQLDLAATAMNKDELQVRIDGLALTRARLQAEISGEELRFPAEEAKRQPALVDAERSNYMARRQELQARLSVLDEQSRQRDLEVQELQAKLRATASSLALAREKLAMSGNLLKEGLTARMDHVAMQGEVETLEGQLGTLRASVPRAEAAAKESRQRVTEEKLTFASKVQAELGETELNIARNRELMTKAADQHLRTGILSPIEGVVKNLRVTTIGGVVRAGEPILEIVPVNDKLLVEAKVLPADRGYVREGQEALVKVTAYDFTRYGGLDGKVIMVAPDSTTGPDNQPYFRVLVETNRAWLGSAEGTLPITPGMQAMVDIQTGTRSVLDYLMKPVIKLKHEAFRER